MKRRHPLWRAFWCLLLGGLVWWLVAWWLEPKPLWRVKLQAKETLIPLQEYPGQHQLLVYREANLQLGDDQSLVLLDLRTGQKLHHLNVKTNFAGSSNLMIPRRHQGHFYRLESNHKDDDGVTKSLVRWNPDGTAQEEILQSWKLSWNMQVDWPLGSTTILLHGSWPWRALFYCSHPNWFSWLMVQYDWHVMLMDMQEKESPYRITQTWQLPTQGQTKPQLLATWQTMPLCTSPPMLSDDGKWTVALKVNLWSKAELLSKLVSRDKALVDVAMLEEWLHIKSSQTVMCNAHTGKTVLTQQNTDYQATEILWVGPFLIASGWKLRDMQPQPADQLLKLMVKSPDLSAIATKVQRIYYWNEGVLQPLRWPDDWPHADWTWQYQQGELIGNRNADGSSALRKSFVVLQQKGEQFQLKYSAAELMSENRMGYEATASQVVAVRVLEDEWEKIVRGWAEKHRWLQNLVEWLWQTIRYETVVYDLPQQRIVARWGSQFALNTDSGSNIFKHFYTLSIRGAFRPEDIELQSFNCYALPVVIYSPWWSRIAALLVAIAFWLHLTRRARRGVA